MLNYVFASNLFINKILTMNFFGKKKKKALCLNNQFSNKDNSYSFKTEIFFYYL